jgi:hypothetical protein
MRSKTSSNLLSTMAILLANYDAARDYLSNFEPFVIDRLKHWPPGEEARPKKICLALTEAYHLPRIPINTVTQLRDRARRDGYLVADYGGKLYPNPEALEEVPSLGSGRTVFLDHFDHLAESIQVYASSVHDRPWTRDEAEGALERFVEEFSVELALAKREGGMEGEGDPTLSRNEALAVVHGFARRALEEDERSLDYLEEVVQASMLANVIYLQDLASWKPSLDRLVAFLDTTVAFRLLGLTDEEVSEAARQMVDLLAEFKVPVRIFEHTLAEIVGVLRGVQSNLRADNRGQTDLDRLSHQGQEALVHALRCGWGPADVEEVIVDLKRRLARQNIAVAATPRPDPRLSLNESRLDEILTRLGFTPNQRAFDSQSLSAIHTVREGRGFTELGQARAIFITSNDRLVKAARLWFEEQGHGSIVPQCTTETSFTTQLWLRRPEGRPDIAHKFLVAESFAALNPSPELWGRYLDRIAQRREREEITEQQVKALVFSTEAKEGLVEVAHGDPERVDDDAIGEVLARYEERVPAAFAEELENTQQDIEVLRSENKSMRAAIAQRERLLKDQTDELALQNRELAALQKKLDRLIGSEERRSQNEKAAEKRRLVAREAAGVLVALGFAATAVLIWFAGGIESGVIRGAIGFGGACLAVISVALGFRKSTSWAVKAIVLTGAFPALFFGLVGIADNQSPPPPAIHSGR